jgi:hypothetical protein
MQQIDRVVKMTSLKNMKVIMSLMSNRRDLPSDMSWKYTWSTPN